MRKVLSAPAEPARRSSLPNFSGSMIQTYGTPILHQFRRLPPDAHHSVVVRQNLDPWQQRARRIPLFAIRQCAHANVGDGKPILPNPDSQLYADLDLPLLAPRRRSAPRANCNSACALPPDFRSARTPSRYSRSVRLPDTPPAGVASRLSCNCLSTIVI